MIIVNFMSDKKFFDKEILNVKNNTVRVKDDSERFDILKKYSDGEIKELCICITNNDTGDSFTRFVRDVSIYEEIYIITWNGNIFDFKP